MYKGESVVSGTSTTGTGTLTLAATPVAPGGADFDVWARAFGFGNSTAILLLYTLIEYTDSTFSTAKQEEVGLGTLTLGGSSGITNCTLSRDTVWHTITSMNSQPASYSITGTKITIGTAANCLLMLAPSTMDAGFNDFVLCDTLGDAKPSCSEYGLGGYATAALSMTTGFAFVQPFIWTGTRPVTKAGIYCTALQASSVVEVGIYQLIDHDTIKRVVDLTNGRANLFSGAATGYKQNTSGGGAFTAFYLPPGAYLKVFLQTGGLGTWAASNIANPSVKLLGTSSGQTVGQVTFSAASLAASITLSTSTPSVAQWASTVPLQLHLGW